MKNWLLLQLISVVLITHNLKAQTLPPFYSAESKHWADSMLATMTRQQCIGQLFMVSAYSNKDSLHIKSIDSLIVKYHPGGLCFFQGGPVRQAMLTKHYQSISKIPMLISIDGEWGLSMRLDSTHRFPRQMTLGAMHNDAAIFEMGIEIARQCKLLGIHINFAPCIDINNNPLNPVINSRSFGENKYDVASKGLLYMKGMQQNGVLACGKHFPGHGNTESDSHFTLPILNQTVEEIDSVELFPFKQLIDSGLGSIMVAHLNIPALDTNNNASTLSASVVNGLLKDSLQFKGIVFTDALNMKGVAAYNQPGELELNALMAGNDILLCTENMPLAFAMIDSAMLTGKLDSNEIFKRVHKILQLKFWCGLNKTPDIDVESVARNIKSDRAEFLISQMYNQSLTLLKNRRHVLPLYSYREESIASLVFSDTLNNNFQNWLSQYAYIDKFRLEKEPSPEQFDSVMNALCNYNKVILSIHNTSTLASKNFNISTQMNEAIKYLCHETDLITVVFGNAYTLGKLPDLLESDAVLHGYEDTGYPNQFAAQVIFGGQQPTGRLPVTPTGNLTYHSGILQHEVPYVIKFSNPEMAGLQTTDLRGIDSLAHYAIQSGATPGCQIAVAYKGNLVYNKSFGYTNYTDSLPVNNNNLYDLASVTKTAATALAVMYLYDKGKIDITKKLSRYLPELKKSNKKDLLLTDVMTHQAGLKAWIPFYKQTIDANGKPDSNLYRSNADSLFSIQIADSFYLRNDYPKIIYSQIIDSPVELPGHYVYSDLGVILMQKAVEHITRMPLDSFLIKTFYRPMALQQLTFCPLSRYKKSEIIPTETDTLWRHQVVQGYVHDMASAMLGGVAGHAGLFSNAASLSILMQMLLQNGYYGGRQYIKPETVDLFTRQYNEGTANRRGLFFDKPEPDKTKNGPTAKEASSATFGHTGFTGTCTWADPQHQLVYVFLSNRIHPDATNNKLANLNIRTDIMQVIYKAIERSEKN